MPTILLTSPTGTEEIAAREAKELIGADSIESGPGYALCNTPDILTACKLAYLAQSLTGAYILLGRATRTDDILDTIKHVVDGIDWRGWLKPDWAFAVRCSKDDTYSSQELCAETGGYILDKANAKVRVSAPDIEYYIHCTEKNVFLGIDLCGYDLGKRSYRIFAGSDGLKGNIAYSILRFAGFAPGTKLVDPFCRSGTIPIEAAIWLSQRSPHTYDKEKPNFRKLPMLTGTDWEKTFNEWDSRSSTPREGDIIAMDANFANVAAARKNAKIAGINKQIHFSRTDLTWLDAKFGKHAIDTIASVPTQPSQRLEEDVVRKIYREFFYQAEFVLKKEGKIALLLQRGIELLDAEGKAHKFAIVQKRTIWLGKEEWTLVTMQCAQAQ